uniref:Uncharacterized protein n=1 Tax=Crocodylus porosus TaxID=8502 RepID=A0A7M4EIT1_CROPO
MSNVVQIQVLLLILLGLTQVRLQVPASSGNGRGCQTAVIGCCAWQQWDRYQLLLLWPWQCCMHMLRERCSAPLGTGSPGPGASGCFFPAPGLHKESIQKFHALV